MLDLLLVPGGLLQGLDDQGRRGRHDRDLVLAVLHVQAAGHAQALPVGGGLGEVITALLRRQAEGTELGGKRSDGADLTTGHLNEDCRK